MLVRVRERSSSTMQPRFFMHLHLYWLNLYQPYLYLSSYTYLYFAAQVKNIWLAMGGHMYLYLYLYLYHLYLLSYLQPG